MIRSLSELSPDTFVSVVYAAIAAAVTVGCAVGVGVGLLSAAARGGES